mmetsp:Transcript_8301/g.20512  ORF Transcript_8301/g.20512 Transcript_8301/m.20512 type:complete len:260 (-) Transcript_8301:4966-5745(-)
MTTQNESIDSKKRLSFYLQMLERLRTESFNLETNEKLATHPYLTAAKEGKLTLAQRRAFAGEQYAIQYSDACSFASLAGHDLFRPESLCVARVPPPKNDEPVPDIFQFLLGGEVYASQLLLDHAKSLSFEKGEISLRNYPITARAQAYPSYWARIALAGNRGAGAAACAVNFPAWGSMCAELSDALRSRPEYSYDSMSEEEASTALAFITFFGTPIENLDEMAASVMMKENVSYDDIVTEVRLLQSYEILFWDSVYDAK